jgi:glycosyltransferase involved in cell wall biosynthesis
MKILQVTISLPNKINFSGAEKFCYELSQKLTQKEIQIGIAAPYSDENFKYYNLLYFRNKYFRKIYFDYFNPLNSNLLMRAITDFKPDIVHFHSLYGISSNLVKIASKHSKTVITAHDYWTFCYFSTMTRNNHICEFCSGKYATLSVFGVAHNIHKQINYNNLKNAHFVAPSKYMYKSLRSIGGFKNITIINNGIEIPNKKTTYDKIILWVGRIIEEKGLQDIIEILNTIQLSSDWRVLIIGDGKLKDILESKYKNVKFLGYQNPVKYYLKASILVCSSVWPENFPYTVLEAMSYGLAVVSTSNGGLPEIVQNNKNGYLYESSDLEKFKKILDNLIQSPKSVRELGQNAKYSVERNYNWNKIVKNYMTFYKNL